MSNARHISAADTAKIVRKLLKREFPSITFGVTSKTYSMGASVSIQWIDGPTEKQVRSHTCVFEGKGFDGSIDLAYGKDAWLLPDGSVHRAKSRGSSNSGGGDRPYDLDAPGADAELVHFGSGLVGTSRHHSPAFVRRVAAEMADKTGWTAPEIIETSSYWSRTKQVETAHFENWRSAEDRQSWEEFSQALSLTPGDGPLVTRFDYAFEEPEPEPATIEVAPERTEAEQIEVYRETCTEIIPPTADERDYITPERAEPDPKTTPHEDPDDMAREFYSAVQEVAAAILATGPGAFVERLVRRKVAAVEGSNDIRDLIKVGSDLTLIAERLELAY